MKSGWADRDAEAIVAEGAKSGIDRDLALRIYTTRLLGRDPKLVLHGGGNTSLKEVMRDRLGADVEVLRVKATGADMAMIDLAGLQDESIWEDIVVLDPPYRSRATVRAQA